MLSGINKVCAQCIEPCKQFKQVTLLNCSNFSTVAHHRSIKKQQPSETGYFPQSQKREKKFKVIVGDSHIKKMDSTVSHTTRGLCPVCLKNKTTGRHHIIPVEQKGSNSYRNKVSLCEGCHDIVEEYASRGIYYSPSLVRHIRLGLQTQ